MDRFSIEDVSSARIPFTLEAGAPENALYLDANGRVGLKTATPMRDLHINSDDTPSLRLEQNFAVYGPRTWDLEANEIGFLVRDVDTGNAPFLIATDAIPAALVVGDAGNVGVGGVAPTAALHVSRGDGSTQVLIENVAGQTQTRRCST